MTGARAIGVATALVAGSLAAGWLTAPVFESDAPMSAASPSVRVPTLAHPGVGIADAVRGLAALRFPSAPPRPVVVASVEPEPEAPIAVAAKPEPTVVVENIADRFRRELTAIMTVDGRPAALMVDPSSPTGRRQVGVGGRYRDGWRVASLEDQHVVLRRGRERRRVPIFDGAPSPEPTRLAERSAPPAPSPEIVAVASTAQIAPAPARARRLLSRPTRNE